MSNQMEEEHIVVDDSDDSEEEESSTAPAMKKAKSSRASESLKLLYNDLGRRKISCIDCIKSGVPEDKVSGFKLSAFGIKHSTTAHADDTNHKRALSVFPHRKTATIKLSSDIVKRNASLSSTTTSSTSQTTLGHFLTPVSGDPRTLLELELARTIVKLKAAPSSFGNLQDLVNAAALFGSRTRFVSFTFPGEKSFVENLIEGKEGLLGQARDDLLDENKPFWSSLKTHGGVLMSDSARDVNSRSIMVAAVSCPAGKKILAMIRPDSNAKTGEWISSQLGSLLDGTYQVGDQELAVSTTGRPLSSASAVAMLTEIASKPGQYLFVTSTDHASPDLNGQVRLSLSHGTLPSGDPSHAAHNLAKELLKPFATFVGAVVDSALFFRNHEALKNLLRDKVIEDNKKGANAAAFTTMKSLPETRFLGIYFTLYCFASVFRSLKESVNSAKWDDWCAANDDYRERAANIKTVFNDANSPLMAEFLCAMLLPVLKMCRFFDAANVGSMGFVYKMWSLMSESIVIAVANKKFASILTLSMVNDIKSTVAASWVNFDFDIYGAAFLVNPYLFNDIKALNEPSQDVGEDVGDLAQTEFYELKESFGRVAGTYFRRFPHHVGAAARPRVLDVDDPIVTELVSTVMLELETYLGDQRNARTYKLKPGDDCSVLPTPGTIWSQAKPGKLKGLATRLGDVIAGATEVERIHWRNARTRTKTRNRLGYVRSNSLVFLDHHLNSKPREKRASFGECMAILLDFMKVTDEDEGYLEAMEARFVEIAEALKKEVEARAEHGQPENDGDEEEDDMVLEEELAERRGRGKRKPSNRFYAMLAAEKARQGSGVDDESDDDY